MGGRMRPLLCRGQGKCKMGEVPQGVCKTWEMCWAQQRPLMEVVKGMLWPPEPWVSPMGESWGLKPAQPQGNIPPPLAPTGLHCHSCPRMDPGTLHRGRGKGTRYLVPQGADLTHKPSPFLHPGLLRSVPWPSAISSGHEMWYLVTHASLGAEPSDTRPPRPRSDMQSVRVWCALEIPACWHLSAARAGQLPSPAHRLSCPSRAPLPWPCSSLLPKSFHQSSFSPTVTHLKRREKQENCLLSDLSAAGPCHQAISPPTAASSLVSAGRAPAVPALSGLATAPLPFPAALQAAV